MRGRWRIAAFALVPAMLGGLAPLATADDPTEESAPIVEGVEYPEVVPVKAKNRKALSVLGDLGFDLGEEVTDVDDGVIVQIVATKAQQKELRGLGLKVGNPVMTAEDMDRLRAEFATMTATQDAAAAQAEEAGDDLRVQRAQWYVDPNQGRFLETEVWSGTAASGPNVVITVAFNAGEGTEIGAPGTQSYTLSRFNDAGQYMFHRANSPVLISTPQVPTRMKVTATLNGEEIGTREVAVTQRLSGVDAKGPGAPIATTANYATGFVSKYMDATESYERIEQLHAEFPELTEIIELPHTTNGYRRKAQALVTGRTSRVVVNAASGAVEYNFLSATGSTPLAPVAGGPVRDLVVVNGGGDAPSQGCDELQGFPTGAIAVVDRGTCTFAVKVANAQAAGASAVVVVNDIHGAPASIGSNYTLPAGMISLADGTKLKAALPATGQLGGSDGATTTQAFSVDSKAWGHEGGNDLTIAAVVPSSANQPLSVNMSGNDITVSLATNASGARTTTAAQAVAAINAHPQASQLVEAYTYRGNAGSGLVWPTARKSLSDFLDAPASVSREPFTVKALRIGRDRDGSKVGVFAYSQEHAREWSTPLVALESAERLLRNYSTDDNTKRMVNDLDIFIVPSINPDGTHFSMYDFMTQRRNLVNYCPKTGSADLNARFTWGVDLNRNFTVGSLFDGYSGASTSCTSDTFAGPSELSEPEAKNEVWLTEQYPNIKFSMNIHSHGGYFMWAPGAYKATGRENLERPSYGTERFFYEASDHILNRIKEHRGTVIWDSRVGPISDVLYSAAGNSGDEHYYNRGIFAWSFEVGASRRNDANSAWTTIGNGFNPPFAEGYEQAMEFSNGLVGMFEVARMYARDTVPPKTTLTPGGTTFTGPTKFTFRPSEPADVYYTTDGSRPTLASAKLEYSGPRQSEASITIDKTTTLRWFSVDVKGNVEGGYDPNGKGQNFRQAKITIR